MTARDREADLIDDVLVRTPRVAALIARARAQALRDAAETIPEVGDVLRRMADREAQP